MTAKTRRHSTSGIRPPLWFLIPAVVFYTVIVVVPNLQGYAYSFTDWNGLRPVVNWVGWQNYARIFDDSGTIKAFVNTILFTIGTVIGQNVIGLLLALGCNSLIKSKYVLRLIFFLPVVLTPIVTAFLWSYVLNPTGSLNEALGSLGLEWLRQDWLGSPELALWSVVVASVWQGVGITMVIYLAALQGVSPDLIEASALDGAGPVRRLLQIILPLINGAVVINIMLTLTGGLKQFDLVFAMTSGGPAESTQTLGFLIYKNAFVNLDYPTAVAQGVVLTLIVALVAIVQIKATSRKED